MPAIIAFALLLLAVSGFWAFWLFVLDHNLMSVIWQWLPWR